MENRSMPEAENIISTRKIWKNIKKYWWICLLCLIAYGAVVARDVWKAYRADQQAAGRDTYQASGMVYYPHSDEEEGKFFVTLCTTERVVEQVNETLLQGGFSKYGSDGDSIEVNWIGNTFGLTLLGEGEDRMACMMEAFLKYLLQEAETVAGKKGSILNPTSVRPCVIKSNGTVVVYEEPSQRQAGLSLRDIVTWRRLMIAAAAFFAGVLVVFVLIIFDEKLRTKEELAEWISVPCLGILHSKKDAEVFQALLEGVCEEKRIDKISFVVWKGNERLAQALQELNWKVKYEILEDVSHSPERMKQVVQTDHILLGIYLNQDKRSVVKQTMEELQLLNSNITGYLLLD